MATYQTFKASVIGFLTAGTRIVFDYGFYDDSGSSPHIDTGTAAGDFQTLVQATLAAALPTEFTFDKYRFACTFGTFMGEIGYVVVDPPVAGTLTGGSILPAEIAISMKRNTGLASRSDRGRVFFGPVHSNYQNTTNGDLVEPDATLTAVADLGKATLTTGSTVLKPGLIKSDGSSLLHQIINTSFGPVFTHRKSRRFRIGV